MINVKVLNKDGTGLLSDLISGLEWVLRDHKNVSYSLSQVSGHSVLAKSIINLSVGGGTSYALHKLAESMMTNGIIIVVAAGNENLDACTQTLPSVSGTIAVGALDKDNSMAYFSNWGKCVDLFAPGFDIRSVIPNGQTAFMSGTSQAAPYVTGIISSFMTRRSPSGVNPNVDVRNMLIRTSRNGTIDFEFAPSTHESPNRVATYIP